MRNSPARVFGLILAASCAFADSAVSGRVLDPQGYAVPGATVWLETATGYRLSATSNAEGGYKFSSVPDGEYRLKVGVCGLSASLSLTLAGQIAIQDMRLSVAAQHQSFVITAKTVEPEVDLRNAEVFNRTLFTRDDQVLQQLNV